MEHAIRITRWQMKYLLLRSIMHNFHLSPPPDGAPGLHPLLVANEETRALRGSSKYTRYIFTTPAALAPPFSLHAYTLIYLLLFLTPKPRPGSTPTPWMWIYHHTPPAPCFLAIPKLEIEARHLREMPPYLCGL